MINVVSSPDLNPNTLHRPTAMKDGKPRGPSFDSPAFVQKAIQEASLKTVSLRVGESPCGVDNRPLSLENATPIGSFRAASRLEGARSVTPFESGGRAPSRLRDTVDSFRSVMSPPPPIAPSPLMALMPSNKDIALERINKLMQMMESATDIKSLDFLKMEFEELKSRVVASGESDLSETCDSVVAHLNIAKRAQEAFEKLDQIRQKVLSAEGLSVEDFVEIREIKQVFTDFKRSIETLNLKGVIDERCDLFFDTVNRIREQDSLLGEFITLESRFEDDWERPEIDLASWTKSFLDIQKRAQDLGFDHLFKVCQKFTEGMDNITQSSLAAFKPLKRELSQIDESSSYKKIIRLKEKVKMLLEVQSGGFILEECTEAIEKLDGVMHLKYRNALSYCYDTIAEFETKFKNIANEIRKDPSIRRNPEFRSVVNKIYFTPLHDKLYLKLENDLFCRSYHEIDEDQACTHWYNYHAGIENWKALQINMHQMMNYIPKDDSAGNEEITNL